MAEGAQEAELVPSADGSHLSLTSLRLVAGGSSPISVADSDTLLYVTEGEGALVHDGAPQRLELGAAGLVLASEETAVEAGAAGLAVVLARVGPGADRHAPLGARQRVVSADAAAAGSASSDRSFVVFFGPHNGSTRATLFAGFVPPGRAPWHYHLYDEIVFVPGGPGRLHREASGEELELGPGSAFRLRPREVHILENTSPDRELTVLGVFTPAGTPSAAYLTPEIAATYRFGE
jgi:quercetin dioxygenase-like cupin family protein